MQDPTTAASAAALFQIQTMNPFPHNFPTENHHHQQQQQQQEQIKCPRCDSTNTKFCYYNNYNLSQPRHFCKNCRRYWTKGGSLRNIPVGGGSRKTAKKSSSSTKRPAPPPPPPPSSSASHTAAITNNNNNNNNKNVVSGSVTTRFNQDRGVSFSSLFGSSGQFGSFLEGLNSNGSELKMVQVGGFNGNFGSDPGLNSGSGRNSGLEMQSNGNSSGEFLGLQNGDSSSSWNNGKWSWLV